jgi:hypothetical protein
MITRADAIIVSQFSTSHEKLSIIHIASFHLVTFTGFNQTFTVFFNRFRPNVNAICEVPGHQFIFGTTGNAFAVFIQFSETAMFGSIH